MLKKNKYVSKIFALVSLLALITFAAAGSIFAQSLNQGYQSDETLQVGMLVKEKVDDRSRVEPVTLETSKDLRGVVVEKNASPVVIATDEQTVFVASTGEHPVLVSNENGEIAEGDLLSVSRVAGIAMKAGEQDPLVLGRALGSFNGSGDNISTTNLANGKQVSLGRIQANINIAPNPIYKSQQNSIPEILEDVSSSVAGKPVSPARIWLATIVFLITSVVTGVMLYGGARSSLLALGRNPLSKSSIIRGLFQVVAFGITVFIFGMFGVYLLLKL